jgi:hypothetical protein
MHVDTQRIAVNVSPWTGVGTVGHFVADRVWITDGQRRVIDDRSDPRASFAGHTRDTPLGSTASALFHQLRNVELSEHAVSLYPTGVRT